MKCVLLRPPYPLFLKFEITDSIPSAFSNCLAVIELANMLCSVSVSAVIIWLSFFYQLYWDHLLTWQKNHLLTYFSLFINPLTKQQPKLYTQKDPLKQNRNMRTAYGCQGWGKMGWEFGISRCKLVYIGWINNKVPLYNTESYIQYPMIYHNGKECKIDVYI